HFPNCWSEGVRRRSQECVGMSTTRSVNLPMARLRTGGIAMAIACGLGCALKGAESDEAAASITADDLMRHIRTLASDEFEGRAPGTKGEQLTVGYLTAEFQRLSLKPGNPGGTYVQAVPLVGATATDVSVSYRAGESRTDLA